VACAASNWGRAGDVVIVTLLPHTHRVVKVEYSGAQVNPN
jgi:hypothetical protein